MEFFEITRKGTGTREWSEISYNIHATAQPGCQHGCRYCYARYNAFTRFKTIQRASDWLHPAIDWKKVNKKWRQRKGVIMFPTQHDITPENLGACVTTIANMLNSGNKVLIVTKPHLECIQKLWGEFKDYKEQILFRFTMGTINDRDLRRWEPHAPTFDERLSCLRFAHDKGMQTSVSAEPLLGGWATAKMLHDATIDYITDTLWYGFLNHPERMLETDALADEQRRDVAFWTSLDTAQFCQQLAQAVPKVRLKDSMREMLEGFSSGEGWLSDNKGGDAHE